jgi:hypothetical protein
MRRVVAAVVTATVAAAGLAVGAGSPASAATTISTRYMLNSLASGSEHAAGYDRSKFRLWVDADHDGCDTRDEVLVQEAAARPRVSSSGCELSGGDWRSKYDGLVTTDPSTFDIDHLVPLNEAWQSGAWNWTAGTRQRYANDLGYRRSLIAVSAHANRSKGDREPQDWMPEKAGYACTYVADWVAVKWRWRLHVNHAERTYLHDELRACGWPRLKRPSRPAITTGSTSEGGGGSTGGTSNTVTYDVHPGAFCSEHGWYGHTSAGTLMRCTITSSDPYYRWRSA